MNDASDDRFERELRASLPADRIDVSDAARCFFGQDVFTRGDAVRAVVAPRSADEVAQVIRTARAAGLHVVPRGGGMSYTSGYLSADPARAVVLDMRAMDRIVEVNAQDMYAVVEPGCTWAALRERLRPLGLRPPYWGPISGLKATVGGSMSQNAIFWGAGLAGVSADSILGLEVVSGAGAVIATGSLGVTGAQAFFRNFGPDMTGLFTGDGGGLGVKTKIVLRLATEPAATKQQSFVAPDHTALCACLSEISRRGLAATVMGLDSELKGARMTSEGLLSDVAHLLRTVRAARSPLAGIAAGWRIVRGGRGMLDGFDFSAHVFLEGATDAAVEADAAAIRALAAAHGLREVEASVPAVMAATPFGPVNGMVGPKGERWAPVHCIVPHSRAVPAFEALAQVVEARRAAFEQHDVRVGYLFSTIATNGFVIEPMFHWPDALEALHVDTVGEQRLQRYPQYPSAPQGRAVVAEARAAMIAAVDALGAVHIQIGRTYPYESRLQAGAAALLSDIRGGLDPGQVVNPGVLRR